MRSKRIMHNTQAGSVLSEALSPFTVLGPHKIIDKLKVRRKRYLLKWKRRDPTWRLSLLILMLQSFHLLRLTDIPFSRRYDEDEIGTEFLSLTCFVA